MENYKEHVKDHDSKKAFWQKALIFVSKDADITKVDVQYLEHKAIVFRVYIKAELYPIRYNSYHSNESVPVRAYKHFSSGQTETDYTFSGE